MDRESTPALPQPETKRLPAEFLQMVLEAVKEKKERAKRYNEAGEFQNNYDVFNEVIEKIGEECAKHQNPLTYPEFVRLVNQMAGENGIKAHFLEVGDVWEQEGRGATNGKIITIRRKLRVTAIYPPGTKLKAEEIPDIHGVGENLWDSHFNPWFLFFPGIYFFEEIE